MTLTSANGHSAFPGARGHSAPTQVAPGHGALVELLDEQVRERVRRENIDPQRDAVVVRRIAEAVVRDHDERSLTGAVAPVADPASVVGAAAAAGGTALLAFQGVGDALKAVNEAAKAPSFERARWRRGSRAQQGTRDATEGEG